MAGKQEEVVHADAVVAADGRGNFKTINAAIAAAPDNSARRYVIHIRAGVYHEFVTVGSHKLNLSLVGDGMEKTVISGSRCKADGYDKTEATAIVTVKGAGFLAKDLGIVNTAGPKYNDGQAVAFFSEADRTVLYCCAIRSFQDTLLAKRERQFYRECHISGTVDFIYGDASAVFQNCNILARLPLPKQKNTITAQGRKSATNSGFVIQQCNIAADDDLSRAQARIKTYLGRPWKPFSRVVVMQSTISGVVDPEGWLPWENEAVPHTIFYAEYSNRGAGADVSRRVHWPGFRVIKDPAEASAFTVNKFINGSEWLPSTGVKYTGGL